MHNNISKSCKVFKFILFISIFSFLFTIGFWIHRLASYVKSRNTEVDSAQAERKIKWFNWQEVEDLKRLLIKIIFF